MAEDSNNSTEELNNLSQEQYKILRTSKGKEAILHDIAHIVARRHSQNLLPGSEC